MDQGGGHLPLLLSAIGIIASILGTFFVRVKEGGDPAKALRIGLGSTGLFMIIGAYFLTNWMFGDLTLFFAVISGVICACLIGAATEYYTSGDYGSVKENSRRLRNRSRHQHPRRPRSRNEIHSHPRNPRLHSDPRRLPVRRPSTA
ncbi:sodium/proton-translocating pyrophosphatase [uncultured Cloacibacillus sp.]|uniref:sodium/proton-translocating pyrophosphatase n=1 Tax=uncultured Cloacibacillus sp. TaxID=889794 RepID=UPI003207F5B9